MTFDCNVCQCRFESPDDLKVHAIAQEGQIFECTVAGCKKECKTLLGSRQSMRVHQIEDDFVCVVSSHGQISRRKSKKNGNRMEDDDGRSKRNYKMLVCRKTKESEWNRYDFHYLTVNVAVRYALEIVETEKKEKKHKEILLVTGNGNHSVNDVAAIKNAVLRDLRWLGYCTAIDDSSNPGVVLVKFE